MTADYTDVQVPSNRPRGRRPDLVSKATPGKPLARKTVSLSAGKPLARKTALQRRTPLARGRFR